MNISRFLRRIGSIRRTEHLSIEDRIKAHRGQLHSHIGWIKSELRIVLREEEQLQDQREQITIPDPLEEYKNSTEHHQKLANRRERLVLLKTVLERHLDILTDLQQGLTIGEIAESGAEMFNALGFHSDRLEKAVYDLGVASEQIRIQVEQPLEEGLYVIAQQPDAVAMMEALELDEQPDQFEKPTPTLE